MKKGWKKNIPEGLTGWFAKGANWIFDVIVVSLLHLICCIPIITVGGAKTSLYKMILRWQRGEDATLPDYLKELKNEFKGGILPGLITVAADVILYLDLAVNSAGQTPSAIRVVTFAVVFYVTALIEQMYMVNANFKVTLRQLVKNALLLSLAHPFRSFLTGLEAVIIPIPVLRTQIAAWINKTTYLELREEFLVSASEEQGSENTERTNI